MFKSKILLFYLIHAITVNSVVNGVKIKCQFYSQTWADLTGSFYTCKPLNIEIFDGSRVKIDAVEGEHMSGKSNDDVAGLYFRDISSLNFLPENIHNIFKNLIIIGVEYSNLQEIRSSDLKPYPQLKYLLTYQTKLITTIDANLFEFNRNLIGIWLQHNNITHIDRNTFDGMNNLKVLRLGGTACKILFGDALTRSDVLRSINRIKKGDCESNDVLERRKNAENSQCNENMLGKYDELNKNYTLVINERENSNKNVNTLEIHQRELQDKLLTCENLNKNLGTKNNDLSKDLKEMQEESLKCEEKSQNISKSNDELDKENKSLLKQLNEMNIKYMELSEKQSELRDKYENLLQTKLIQSESLNEKLLEKVMSPIILIN